MARFFEDALTYDDVLLVPRRSDVHSRKDVSTETWLTPRIRLNIPVVSANMDTVTESQMAIAMARLGGVGIIHRFLSVEDQVAEVQKVKRIENFRIERPYTLQGTATLQEARAVMKRYGVSCLLITNAEGRLFGLLSSRDIRFETDERRPIAELMTPRERLIVVNPSISLPEARELLRRHKYEKLPLVDEAGNLQGLITGKDIARISEYPQATKDKKGRLRVGAAIGVKDTIQRAEELVNAAEVDVLVLDVAHGHNERALQAISALRARFGNSVEIIAGNVATPSGARDLVSAGADAVKVGIGPGTTCTTRIVAGVGVPQLTAVLRVCEALSGKNVPVIADGGVRYPGDMSKALAAGAATVMLGGLLAGTDESPGITVMRNGRKYKMARGMASLGAAAGRRAVEGGEGEESLSHYVAEGVEAAVPYRGKAEEVIEQLLGGLRSGMSYCNARTIAELQMNAGFVRITEAGRRESLPHDVEVL